MQRVAELQADETAGRLRPSDWGIVHRLLAKVSTAVERRRPNTTRNKDKSYWRFWVAATMLLGTEAIRSNVSATLGQDAVGYRRETTLVEMVFMLWVITNPQYKPSSMLQRLHGVSRVHRLGLRLPFVSLAGISQLCKGVVQELIDEHGPEAIEVTRREPLQNWMLVRWTTMVGIKVGYYVAGDNEPWLGVVALICYLASTGARKADVAIENDVTWGPRHLSLANVCYEMHGVMYPCLTDQQHEQLDTSCFLHFKPVPCKNDPDNSRWGATPTTCRWHPTQPVNLARAFAKYDRRRGVPPEKRRSTPMFVDHEGRPWRKGRLAYFFNLLLLLIMSAAEARKYTVHSFRIYLACALLAAGASKEMIKKMCRWASDEALNVYARDNADCIAAWIDAARTVGVTSVRTTSLPTAVPRTLAADVNGVTFATADAPCVPRAALSDTDRAWMAANTPPKNGDVVRQDAAATTQRVLDALAADAERIEVSSVGRAMADLLEAARTADVTSVPAESRPVVDDFEAVARIHRDAGALERAAKQTKADGDAETSYDPRERHDDDSSEDEETNAALQAEMPRWKALLHGNGELPLARPT
jgi:hypothetical protein